MEGVDLGCISHRQWRANRMAFSAGSLCNKQTPSTDLIAAPTYSTTTRTRSIGLFWIFCSRGSVAWTTSRRSLRKTPTWRFEKTSDARSGRSTTSASCRSRARLSRSSGVKPPRRRDGYGCDPQREPRRRGVRRRPQHGRRRSLPRRSMPPRCGMTSPPKRTRPTPGTAVG